MIKRILKVSHDTICRQKLSVGVEPFVAYLVRKLKLIQSQKKIFECLYASFDVTLLGK